ncbi:translation initiation factor IF-1 [Candidatus Absconditicoccus praedator]|uniref:translation initiation factor IF-1 n=1 Tax=Candidatus Absconditicoccus praedator TaxID=2735562 RepID=UPI001E5DE4AA|nr:translation initiation factor IF-1 [Candidatus Absconditicoccus praedator]UFX82857.1 translation initiation factor IF-1 [Candidatus Absconditicoccus praedator]
MSNQDAIVVEGVVEKILGGGDYQIKIDDMDMVVKAYASGKIKKNNIKIIEGDRVQVELNEYDPQKGRIIYRSNISK